jgi:hypothetical protein
MTNGSPLSNRVIDLLRFKSNRAQRRLNFDAAPEPRPALAPVAPFRPLTAREISHRERMMQHLRITSSR